MYAMAASGVFQQLQNSISIKEIERKKKRKEIIAFKFKQLSFTPFMFLSF